MIDRRWSVVVVVVVVGRRALVVAIVGRWRRLSAVDRRSPHSLLVVRTLDGWLYWACPGKHRGHDLFGLLNPEIPNTFARGGRNLPNNLGFELALGLVLLQLLLRL